MRGVISGKRILVVDDSVVRSTTITRVIKMLRKAGAKEIHVRVASPPIKSTCHFGVDMATLNELIAANKTVTEITEYIGADSLAYLSEIGRAHVWTPVTGESRMPSSAWKKKNKQKTKKQKNKKTKANRL